MTNLILFILGIVASVYAIFILLWQMYAQGKLIIRNIESQPMTTIIWQSFLVLFNWFVWAYILVVLAQALVDLMRAV